MIEAQWGQATTDTDTELLLLTLRKQNLAINFHFYVALHMGIYIIVALQLLVAILAYVENWTLTGIFVALLLLDLIVNMLLF